MLERQMQELRNLPDRMTNLESQILQLRQEMRDEFSALRGDVRGEIRGAMTTLRGELQGEIATAVKTLGEAIASTNTQMRVLHEDVITRLATTGEGRRPRRKSR